MDGRSWRSDGRFHRDGTESRRISTRARGQMRSKSRRILAHSIFVGSGGTIRKKAKVPMKDEFGNVVEFQRSVGYEEQSFAYPQYSDDRDVRRRQARSIADSVQRQESIIDTEEEGADREASLQKLDFYKTTKPSDITAGVVDKTVDFIKKRPEILPDLQEKVDLGCAHSYRDRRYHGTTSESSRGYWEV